VFNLSSWALDRRPLADWLVSELTASYDVPRRIAKRWIDGNRIVPLLDGLDEVTNQHRNACAEAINAFRGRDHGLLRLAVCIRTGDYQTLTTQLRLHEAIEVQPPTDAQMDDYLAALGTSTAELRDAVHADRELMELLRSWASPRGRSPPMRRGCPDGRAAAETVQATTLYFHHAAGLHPYQQHPRIANLSTEAVTPRRPRRRRVSPRPSAPPRRGVGRPRGLPCSSSPGGRQEARLGVAESSQPLPNRWTSPLS